MTTKGIAESSETAPQSLGLRLRTAREYHDMSVATLARRIGVEPDTIAAWETDEQTPRANRLPALSGILDVTLPWLLDGRDDGSLTPRLPSLSDLRRDLDGIAHAISKLASAVETAREHLSELERE